MSEKKERTLEEIQKEFGNLVVKAGQCQYQIHVLTQDLELLNNNMRDLNFEAASLQANQEKKDA